MSSDIVKAAIKDSYKRLILPSIEREVRSDLKDIAEQSAIEVFGNNLEKLTNYVIEQIKKRCNEFLDENKYMQVANSSKDKILKDRFNFKNEILVLEKKLKDIDKLIDKLYEDKCKGLFEDEDFTRLYSKQIEMRKDTNERIKCLQKQIENEDSSVDINKLVKDFVELKEITRTMMVSLIDRIEVSEDKEITIYYKFNILNMRKLNDEEELINVG